jgi:hypothetical protein
MPDGVKFQRSIFFNFYFTWMGSSDLEGCDGREDGFVTQIKSALTPETYFLIIYFANNAEKLNAMQKEPYTTACFATCGQEQGTFMRWRTRRMCASAQKYEPKYEQSQKGNAEAVEGGNRLGKGVKKYSIVLKVLGWSSVRLACTYIIWTSGVTDALAKGDEFAASTITYHVLCGSAEKMVWRRD